MPTPLRVAIVTGTRAEFGLLRPVIDAAAAHPRLRVLVVAAGSHFLPPARTIREVQAAYVLAARVPMQTAAAGSPRTRSDDASATARGIDGFARTFARLRPDWVVVLGDRIEAFAAAAAASIAGLAVCHIHGGDRAEGIADEAMRHAITKLSHLHAAATPLSATRILAMGEEPARVHVTGSPAIDGLRGVRPIDEAALRKLLHAGPAARRIVRDNARPAVRFGADRPADDESSTPLAAAFMLHPSGLTAKDELAFARGAVRAMRETFAGPILALAPNHDPGREHVVRALRDDADPAQWRQLEHLPRTEFVALLKWMARRRVPLVGNSSAGLIECAALGVPVINLGPRQAGRERFGNTLDVDTPGGLSAAKRWLRSPAARAIAPSRGPGDGRAGRRIAALLASPALDPHTPGFTRKRNAY